MPIAIERKINLINEMLPMIAELDTIPYTYNGGTFPYYVEIDSITINNQFVTIKGGTSRDTFIQKERYNVNKVSLCGDENCRKDLERTLNVIIKAFTQSSN